jgi:glycosyltransferase involved in cell wall biosynthesis
MNESVQLNNKHQSCGEINPVDLVDTPDVDILLATCNGESYLPALLESLQQQSYSNWKLIVSDDNSTDATMDIIKTFAARNPDKVAILSCNTYTLGACQNFARLIDYTQKDYVMFCDQDDVWLSDKILLTLLRMREEEQLQGKALPLMVFTDLVLTDAANNVIANSFWDYEHINPFRISLKHLLVQNVSTGCTVMANRALIARITVIPEAAIVHDWWLALVAASFGSLVPLVRQTMQYRQHETNCIGARRWALLNKISSLVSLFKYINRYRATFSNTYAQAESFLSIYSNNLTSQQTRILKEYAVIGSASWIGKRLRTINNSFFRYGLIRKLAQLLFM